MPQRLSAMKNKQKVLQRQAEKSTKKEEQDIAQALVDQLMRLMENAANFTKNKKTASKKAMIWPNKMIPWLRKMLMKKFLGNEGDFSSNEGMPNIGGFSQTSMATDKYGDAELPSTQSNENSPQEEFPDNYDGFVSKSRTHHNNLKLFPLLNMLKTKLNGGIIGMSGGPNLVAKQLLNQLLGGASDRGAVVREMLQEFSLSNGNDRDSSEAREAYNELLGGNPLAPIPQTSVLPGLGPGTTSLAQDKSMNMLQAMPTQQSELPMAFGRGRTATSITDDGLQTPKLLAGLPSPLVQKMMAEGDTFEEIKDPNSLRTEAYTQSPVELARALQLEKAQAQLGETRARLQESPNGFINNQPITQTANMQDLLAMRRNFPLKRKQIAMFQRYPAQLRKLYKDNLERAEVNRLMRLGPNFSAWPKSPNAVQLPSELGTNMESLAQQRSFNPRFPTETVGERNILTYLNQQNVLEHAQLDPANPRLARPQLNQFRSRNPIGSTAMGLQDFLGNRVGLRASTLSRFDNQRMNAGLMGVLNRRADLPTGKTSFKKKINEKVKPKNKPK